MDFIMVGEIFSKQIPSIFVALAAYYRIAFSEET